MAELLPVLVAYSSLNQGQKESMYLVRPNMQHYRKSNRMLFFPAAVKALYGRTVNSVHFHHIESVITRHDLPLQIEVFISEGDERVPQLIDAIYGSLFSLVQIPGIYAGLRICPDNEGIEVAHVYLFFKGSKDVGRQLTAAYRAANVISVCSGSLIGTLNLLKQWQLDVPNRYRLTKTQPDVQTALFVPKGSCDLDKDAIERYRVNNKIVGNVYQIPYGFQDMDAVKTAANDPEQSDSAPEADFVEYWKQVLCEGLKSPYEADVGLDLLRQIVATYIALIEFKDLPIKSVLKYCELEMVQNG
jgi:hypothetical protein